MIAPGTYTAVATGHKLGHTKSDKPQIAVQFQIIDGDERGQTVIWYGYFTAKTIDRTLQSLRFCGWKGDDIDDIGDLPYKVQIVIETDTYDPEKPRAKVAWVNSLGAGAIQMKKPMDAGAARKFAAQVKGRAAKVAEVDGEIAESGSNGESEAPPPGDEDAPWEGQGCSDVEGDEDLDGVPWE